MGPSGTSTGGCKPRRDYEYGGEPIRASDGAVEGEI